jgi:hypothetical protein
MICHALYRNNAIKPSRGFVWWEGTDNIPYLIFSEPLIEFRQVELTEAQQVKMNGVGTLKVL